MKDSNDVRSLFAVYVIGEITGEQLHVLEAALRNDEELRREFIEYLNIDSALGDLAALSKVELQEVALAENEFCQTLSEARPSSQSGVSRTVPASRGALFIGTVMAALLISAILWIVIPGTQTSLPVATLVSKIDATVTCNGEPFNENGLTAGKYQLSRGLLHLRFDGGVMVYVEAPAEFDALNDKLVVLNRGRLSARVPPDGIGFTVQTPEAEVIDFGTEFSVEVDTGTSEVHVFDGMVRVQRRTKQDGALGEPVNVRTSQAIKIERVTDKPIKIELAEERFIRTFDEPKMKYPRAIKRLSPVAYYRMPIRDRGLAAEPPQYSGIVLTGDGRRPPHAKGVRNGGSLRIMADSTGRGGRVDTVPPLQSEQLTVAAFVYLEGPAPNGIVATNIQSDQGTFALSLDENGFIQATIRNGDGALVNVASNLRLPLQTWRHLIMTFDGSELRIYEDGQLTASSQCTMLADTGNHPLWFGTDSEGLKLWNGRIDELAFFDRALSDQEIMELRPMALEEMAITK